MKTTIAATEPIASSTLNTSTFDVKQLKLMRSEIAAELLRRRQLAAARTPLIPIGTSIVVTSGPQRNQGKSGVVIYRFGRTRILVQLEGQGSGDATCFRCSDVTVVAPGEKFEVPEKKGAKKGDAPRRGSITEGKAAK